MKLKKVIYKEYIVNSNCWETKIKYFNIINVYKKSLYKKTISYSFFSDKTERITKPILYYLSINKDDIKREYNGNNWLVPINYIIKDV